MAASRRYYPGFFGALFLVLLRTAIGWHFLYEGLDKVESARTGDKPFSAEGYLRASAGPFAPNFRNLVPDVDSLELLDPDRLKRRWEEEIERAVAHYGFSQEQAAQAKEQLAKVETQADAWFADRENAEKVAKYRQDVELVNEREAETPPLSYERERLAERRKGLETTRRQLVGPVDGWGKSLETAVAKLADESQARRGPLSKPQTQLDLVNSSTMWGLVICGACLLLGLFTPAAALGGATLLAMFYFSMPPWPGLPQPPNSEGHYLIVNKNLVEFLACLVLASTPNGLWIGLDSLLFGWIGRPRPDADDPDADADPDRHR